MVLFAEFNMIPLGDRSSQEAEELSQFLDINLKRRLPEQTERYEEVDSALNEDEADPSENPPDLVVVGLSEEERLFRSLLRKKQIHVKESLKALRFVSFIRIHECKPFPVFSLVTFTA